MKPNVILGLNAAYHESSAVIVVDGQVLIAVEEERFNRVRHAKQAKISQAHELPWSAINTCLHNTGIPPNEIESIVYGFSPRVRHIVHHRKEDSTNELLQNDYGTSEGEKKFEQACLSTKMQLARQIHPSWGDRFHFIPHHTAHAASAVFSLPQTDGIPDKNIAFLSIDGIGEVETTRWGTRDGFSLHSEGRLIYPHSLGFLWERITEFLGYRPMFDEAKIMALAAYGDPDYFHKIFASFVKVNKNGGFTIDNNIVCFRTNNLTPLESKLGPRLPRSPTTEQDQIRQQNIAAALQALTNRIMIGLGQFIASITESKILALAGGCTLNCVAINALAKQELFEHLWVQPAANDAGTALGAALWWANVRNHDATWRTSTPYLGTSISEHDVIELLKRESHHLKWEQCADVVEHAASDLKEGNVIGWIQGRMEFGPRALGNRSLLANPNKKGIREKINKIKGRQWFRPIAASILKEHASDWFYIPDCARLVTQNMNASVLGKEITREKIPDILHIDDSCRIQCVGYENQLYLNLLNAFHSKTGFPVLANTSFNFHEPIVQSAKDVIKTFLKFSNDVPILYVGNLRISKY